MSYTHAASILFGLTLLLGTSGIGQADQACKVQKVGQSYVVERLFCNLEHPLTADDLEILHSSVEEPARNELNQINRKKIDASFYLGFANRDGLGMPTNIGEAERLLEYVRSEVATISASDIPGNYFDNIMTSGKQIDMNAVLGALALSKPAPIADENVDDVVAEARRLRNAGKLNEATQAIQRLNEKLNDQRPPRERPGYNVIASMRDRHGPAAWLLYEWSGRTDDDLLLDAAHGNHPRAAEIAALKLIGGETLGSRYSYSIEGRSMVRDLVEDWVAIAVANGSADAQRAYGKLLAAEEAARQDALADRRAKEADSYAEAARQRATRVAEREARARQRQARRSGGGKFPLEKVEAALKAHLTGRCNNLTVLSQARTGTQVVAGLFSTMRTEGEWCIVEPGFGSRLELRVASVKAVSCSSQGSCLVELRFDCRYKEALYRGPGMAFDPICPVMRTPQQFRVGISRSGDAMTIMR